MNDDEAIGAEMRLWALELLFSNLFAIICASDPEWVELFERTRRAHSKIGKPEKPVGRKNGASVLGAYAAAVQVPLSSSVQSCAAFP